MGDLKFVRFVAEDFPGETQAVLNFSVEDWKEVFLLDSDYVKYVSFRAPIFFVGEEEMKMWGRDLCCLSRDLLARLREKVYDLKEEEVSSELFFAELEEEIEKGMKIERKKYEKVTFPARYISNFNEKSYSGPAVLICPERLEKRIMELEGYYELGEWVPEWERQNLLKRTLRAVYSHEMVRSYIDAWSTPRSFSRREFSCRERVNAFYHLVLEESIATAVEVWEYWVKGGQRSSMLSSLYPQYLLARLPTEHLGFYHLISSFEGELHFRKELSILGGLVDSYCSEDSSPPLWTLKPELLFRSLGPIEKDFLERILKKRISEEEFFWYWRRYWRYILEPLINLRDPEAFVDLWKIAAISWLLSAPTSYSGRWRICREVAEIGCRSWSRS